MKLTIVFPVMNQFPLARVAIEHAVKNVAENWNTELLIIDNASDVPFELPNLGIATKIVRLEKSIGVYPTFWEALKHTDADVLAFFHSDLIVTEQNWDTTILGVFRSMDKLGLVGFIGSNEIDGSGGRGLGTTSNFQGKTYVPVDQINYEGLKWTGSPAHVHGKVNSGFTPAAVVDGCAMIFRRSTLQAIPQRENFPPHHFYDRLLSSEVREKGYTMGVFGIACDHISGQTANQESKWQEFAEEWCKAHGVAPTHNWDDAIYHEAERQWLSEYRDIKRLVPCRV